VPAVAPCFHIVCGLTWLTKSIPVKIGSDPEEGQDDQRSPDLIGLRDRALIATMAFTFARIGAVLGMKVEDYLFCNHYPKYLSGPFQVV
jgi:hypothetical protein